MAESDITNIQKTQEPVPDPQVQPLPAQFMRKPLWLGIYLITISVIMIFLIYMLWPVGTKNAQGILTYAANWKFFGQTIPISDDARLILLVLLAGGLGSYIHSATSFVTFTGNRTLISSWLWWYLLRPFIGGALALIFYFVIRGGFLSTGADVENISVFGMTGLAALVGMFSKNAIDKLQEVFETLFKSKAGQGDDARKDKTVDKTMVEQIMIPANKISAIVIPEGTTISNIKILDLYKMYEGIVTRVPVVTDKKVLKYIIHQSVLFGYIARQTITTSGDEKQFDITKVTLEDFINFPGMTEYVEKSIAVVSRQSTLSEAKQKMEAVKNCQDVFVTETGIRDEPIVGWLTNVDITKNLNQ